jgi:hypothetical protein
MYYAWFAYHGHMIELWLVRVFALVVHVAAAVAASLIAERFWVTQAGLTGIGDEIGGARVLCCMAGVAVAQILDVVVLS